MTPGTTLTGARSFGAACFATLGLFMLAGIALPFLPARTWSASGYQCASYYLLLPLGREHGCVAGEAFGEGARVANRLDFVSYRSEKFTVDARGFRNPPLATLNPRVLLTGSSFSLGLSLSDDETLSAQLNRRLGPVVYNSSKVLNPALSASLAMGSATDIGLRRGWVLLELLNRAPYGYDASREETGLRAKLMREGAPLQSWQRRLKDPFAYHRITAMVNMRIENDVLLPNPDRWRFPEETLTGGRRMLFYSDDKWFFAHPAGLDKTVASVSALRGDLAEHGLRLAVALVPSGYSVYWPLFAQHETQTDGAREYMAGLNERLSAAGIPVLNCLPVLRRAAVREFAHGGLVYWPDDAHWNPTGVAAAADAIAPWLSRLLASDQSAF